MPWQNPTTILKLVRSSTPSRNQPTTRTCVNSTSCHHCGRDSDAASFSRFHRSRNRSTPSYKLSKLCRYELSFGYALREYKECAALFLQLIVLSRKRLNAGASLTTVCPDRLHDTISLSHCSMIRKLCVADFSAFSPKRTPCFSAASG